MEAERAPNLSSIGVAVRAASPALLHAIRGGLHDVTMLVALLQRSGAAGDGASSASSATQRLAAINAQLELLGRNVALLASMTEWPSAERDAVCACANVLPDVVRLLKDEAARHRIRFEHDVDALPPHVRADERALKQSLLACGAWVAQHASERAQMRFVGREEGDEALFEFDADGAPGSARASRDELTALAALAAAAGGRLATSPPLALAFARATGPRPVGT